MKRPSLHTLSRIGLLTAASALLMGAVVFEGGPNAIIFPRHSIPLKFDHNYHVRPSDDATQTKGEGLACTFCHENISDQASAADRDIPGHSVCENCHGDWIGDEKKPAAIKDCARCHKDLDPTGTSTKAKAMAILPPNIKFAHADHVKANIECDKCHARVKDRALATRDDYPTMDRCIACHKEQKVPTECSTCHLTQVSGRLVTAFPEGELKPARYHASAVHSADFLRDHSVPANRDPQYCKNCHSTDDCMQCHDGVGRNARYHPGDWIAVHGTRSRTDDFRCMSCHRVQSFCLDCHVRSGVASVVDLKTNILTRRTIRVDSSGLATGPHPMSADGWLNPGSRNFHGFFAQRSIQSCASCHQEQYCLTCHASGFGTGAASRGGNPHGPNPERLKGTAVRNNNARVCLKCHSPFDPSWR
ncbi:MAG: cytochrome c3 family protein [Myxococcota bacterium]